MIPLSRKVKSFAAYLEDQYYDQMFIRLKSYIFQNRGRLNLHTSLVHDPSYIELDDLHVMGVSFKETEDDRILFRAAIQTDIIVKGRSRRDYEEDVVYPVVFHSFTGILRCGLNMVTITSVGEYSKERFSKEDAFVSIFNPVCVLEGPRCSRREIPEKVLSESIRCAYAVANQGSAGSDVSYRTSCSSS